MKKILYPVIFLLFGLFAAKGYAAEVEWSKEYSEQIQRGVVYRYILKYSSVGFTKLHIVECDLNDPAVSIGIMTAQNGSSYLENTKKMAENNGAVAAINGDFFNMGSARTNMLGLVYQKGELVSTPSKDIWASFAVTGDSRILMDYFSFSGKIISPQGYEIELYQINKMPSTGGAVNLFTPKWGKSVYCGENMQAMLIKDGIVTDKVSRVGDIAFDDNDMMLLTNYTVNGYFDNFNIGDSVQFEYSVIGIDDSVLEATGGNTLLVKDGKRADFTNNSAGYAQRSAAGIDASGKKLILAVCDGREKNCRGMTQADMADALIELGCVKAINFDGGGSSTMAVRDEITGDVKVKNAVTSLRNVSTSVGVFNNSEYIGEAVSAVIKLSADTVLKGDYIEVYYKFNDINCNAVYIDNPNITTTDSAAVISNGRIYFNTAGVHNVCVSFGDVTATAEITVIDDIDVQSAAIFPSEITVKEGESKNISLSVWDSLGNKAYVHPENIAWITQGVSVKGSAVGYGKGYIGVEFPNVAVYCSVNGMKTPDDKFSPTDFMVNKKDEGKIIRISAGCEKYTTIANMIRVLNYEYSLEDADSLYMLKKPLIKDLNYQGVDACSQKAIDNTLIVTLNSSSGSIDNDGQLSNVVKLPEVYEKNIIIISENIPASLPDEEYRLFTDAVQKAKNNGKNVFIVYKDVKTRSYKEDGIYYIGCSSVKGDELSDYIRENKTVDFYISEDKITYSM